MANAMKEAPLILDVRKNQEFLKGHAPGILNLPLERFVVDLPSIERDHPILVCYASGARSSIAKRHARKKGIQGRYKCGSLVMRP